MVLHSISSRPELNGAAATVIDWNAETKRYAVEIEGGERVKIKAKSVRPAPVASAPKDGTLFVSNGQFLQPAAPAADAGSAADGTPERRDTVVERRLQLPAGHWEVRLIDQDAGSIAVTLLATEQKPTDAAVGGNGAAWNELRGLTCTRTFDVEADEDALSGSVVAEVEGGVLTVRVPLRAPEPEEGLDATGVTVEEEEEAMDVDEIAAPPKKARACVCPSCLAGTEGASGAADGPDKENCGCAQPPKQPHDPDAMQRWTAKELEHASMNMPPVCVLGC